MQKYIVLLRKVNIGGKNKVLMSDLKKEIENIGCKNVILILIVVMLYLILMMIKIF